MPKIAAKRYDGDCYRMLDGERIIGLALKFANGKWGAFDLDHNRLKGPQADTPRQVAAWFTERTNEQAITSLPTLDRMISTGDEIIRLSFLISRDINGRIGGEVAKGFFAMIEANAETWRNTLKGKSVSNPQKVADALKSMGIRAQNTSDAFGDQVDGDGAIKFNLLMQRIKRDLDDLFVDTSKVSVSPTGPGPQGR